MAFSSPDQSPVRLERAADSPFASIASNTEQGLVGLRWPRSSSISPTVTSGIRLGSPAGATRGFGIAKFQLIGNMIVEVLDGLVAKDAAVRTLRALFIYR